MGAEANLKAKNITLPTPPTPLANYVGAVRVGNLLFVSGHGPTRTADGKMTARGKVGKDLSTEHGAHVARDVGLNLLATVRTQLGSLVKVKRIVKVLGMVNASEDFGEQPKVMNGFSDLMVRSEQHTSELQSQSNLVCRLLLAKNRCAYGDAFFL